MKQLLLKPGKDKLAQNRHPWIFSGALKQIPRDLELGQEVRLCTNAGQPLGTGHFCGPDGLSVRMLSFNPNEKINNEFYLNRFRQAVALRKLLGLPNQKTTAYRLIHGEGDGLSGLVCDIFEDAASIECTNPGLTYACEILKTFLKDELKLRQVFMTGTDGVEHMPFFEHGIRFVANCTDGQKTGHFLDQRENRRRLSELAKDKTMLDAFCYSGGFSLYGLMGGAKSVTSLDISEQALNLVSAHIANNGPFAGAHKTWCEDAFTALRSMEKNHYDLVVLDPPAFAKSAPAVSRAARGYKDINMIAMKNIKAGGLIFTFSCSQHIDMDLFKKIIFAAAKDANREVSILEELGQGPDHPVSVYCPQSSYLKGLLLHVG